MRSLNSLIFRLGGGLAGHILTYPLSLSTRPLTIPHDNACLIESLPQHNPRRKFDMKVVCAWCNESIHEDPAEDDSHSTISHGICEGCLPRIVEEIGVSMDEFLHANEPPTIVTSPAGEPPLPNELPTSDVLKPQQDHKTD